MQGGLFCHRKGCLYSGEDLITVKCSLCKEHVFCSNECKIELRGMFHHIEEYCDQKHTYTPRSVLSRVLDSIRESTNAKRILYDKFIRGQGKRGPGVMYLVVLDMETVCTMLNSCITDTGIMMSSLASFTPLKELNPRIRELRQALIETDMANGPRYFVLCIHAKLQGTVIHKIKL